MQDAVTIHIDAPVEAVWDLVSDVTRIGEFSPETFEAEWLDGATGPAVGARFRGHVKRNEKGPTYWTTCEVIVCDVNERFTFDVKAGGRTVNTWGYKLQAAAKGGTELTEFFHAPESIPFQLYWTLFGWPRKRRNRNDMRRTLEAMKKVLEASPA